MKHIVPILLVALAGCSTAPVADFLDRFKPGRLPPGPYYGGVCGNPQPAVPSTTAFAPATPEGEATGVAPAPVGASTAVATVPPAGASSAPDSAAKVPVAPSWRRP